MATAREQRPTGGAIAAIAGALAWTVPYLLLPFIPSLPEASFPPFRVELAESAISFALAASIASALFLLCLHRYLTRPGQPDAAG